MKVAASKTEQVLGALMILAAIVYLVQFVPRGWMPHDEGMLGQSADQVLRGGLPHIDYEEAYTGGLSWLYAAVFRATGVDLLNIRWFLFIGASWAAWLVYTILRRYLRPMGAGLATWVAFTWSFPNYFAGLPSWWLLICALACVLALIRYAETERWSYLAAAGLAAGVAIAIKQTGVYLLVALVLSLLYDGGRLHLASTWLMRLERLVRWGAATTAIVFAALILMPRLLAAEGLYLFLPASACAVVVLLRFARNSTSSEPRPPVSIVLVAVLVAGAAAAVPLLFLMIPYASRHRLWDFISGTVLAPRKRLAFASAPMSGAWLIVAGVPLLPLVFRASRSSPPSRSGIRTSLVVLFWVVAILLPIFALWDGVSYQIIWQSSRAVAALLPLGICWQLASGRVSVLRDRLILFMSAATLAWTSINQFPFAAPIYFCYVAPLVVIAAVVAANVGSRPKRQAMVPWAVALLLFAVLSANRGYIENLGVFHAPRRFNRALNLPRAHLRVVHGDRDLYRSLMRSISGHLRGGPLIAGPDCPEVYFLAGLVNPSGKLFEFLSEDADDRHEDREDPVNNVNHENGENREDREKNHEAREIRAWSKGEVIILNHGPHFSPPPSERVVTELRRQFPYGEDIGRFEVRWR